MKYFNYIIFSKLIFSVKVLMLCRRKNVARFLRLLIILKYTLDYFYDGSEHYESRTDCNSCHVHNYLILCNQGHIVAHSSHCLLVRQRKNS